MAYSTDLTERAKEGEIDPVVGRDRERVEIRELLLRKKRPSIMLLGEAGVGKTAIAEGLAQDIVDGKGEAELANARVIALDLNAMNAGTQFRGMFEERLKPILEGLEERGGYLKGQKVILFIDEIHSALTAGNAIGGTSAGQIMKPVLARGGVTCIGATTTEEFKKHIEDDKAMMRRFQRYNLQETKTDDTVKILNSVQQVYSHYHHMKEEVASDVCEYIVRMTDRFMPNQQQPDKSIGIIDDALSIARAKGKRRLSKEHVITAVAKATGLEREFIDQSDFDRYLNLEENLGKRVIGQAQAKKRVAKDLIAGRAGLTKEKAPRLVAVFPGPTGVGKTEVAKALAENLMGSEDNLVRIDMSKYKEQHSVSGLIGAPPGYVGHDQEGELTKAVREKPHSIILLDEIEKAHPEIYKVMLSIFDDGELKDNKGRMVDFTNTVIIMTTNLGSKEIQKKLGGDNMGFSAPSEDTNDKPAISNADIDKICRQAIEREFAPEVVNRIDGIYPFYALTRDEVVQILDLRIRDMQKNLSKSAMGLQLNNCTLEIDPKLKEKLAEDGYSPKFGARNLERPLRALQGDLGEWMMRRRDELKKMNREGPFTLKVSGLGEEFNAKAEKASKPAMDDAPAFLKKSAATPKP